MLLAAWAAYCLFGIGVCGFWGRDGRYWPLWCRFMLPGWVSAVSFCSSALLLGGWGAVWVGVWAFGWVDGWVFGRLGGWMGGSMGLGGFYGFVRMRVALWLCPFGLYGTRSVSNSYISCL